MKNNLKTIFIITLVLVFAFSFGVVRAETPQEGGDLVIGIGENPDHLNPGITTSYPVAAVTANVYSGLVWRAEDGSPQPQLAESWDVSEDNTVFTFHLKENITWHDGEAFTSEDVKFSFEEVLPEFHGRFQDVHEFIEDIETPDDNTVVIALTEAYAPFLVSLEVYDAPIMPKHLLEGNLDNISEADITVEPVGTGPFQFVEWERGDRIVLERNENYFDDNAYLDRVLFNIIPDSASRISALETGQIDYLWGFYFPRAEIPRFQDDPNFEMWQGVRIPALWFAFFNLEHPELGDPLVRQALMHATDRDLIIELTQEGLGDYNVGPMGGAFDLTYFEEYDYSNLYPFDLDKARELLDEAGVDELDISVVVDPNRDDLMGAAEIMQDLYSQIGVNLSIDTQERAVMIESVYENRDYDLSLQSFTSGGDPAVGYHRLYITQEFGTPFVGATGYSNEDVDRILAEAATIPFHDERKEKYREAMEILSEDVPLLVLYEEESVDVNDVNLRGLRQGLDVRSRLDKVWWAQ